MKIADLVFTGFNSRVAALERSTGNLIWQWKAPKGSAYVSLLLDGGVLVVSVNGYMYGLNPLDGQQLWFNNMDGFGTGVTSLVSVNGVASNASVVAAVADVTARQSAASASSAST